MTYALLALACWVRSRVDHTLDKIEISQLRQVRDLLARMAHGRKINAISDLAAMTGDGRKESKDLIDAAMSPKSAAA